MSNPISGNSQGINPGSATLYKKNWISGFRRLQVALAWWGLLILVAGWLHNTYAGSWGSALILLMWLIVAGLGVVGNYILTPAFLSSGVLFIWVAAIALGFVISWLVLYPIDDGEYWPVLSVSWHLVFALGYLVNGYFSDKRLWWLAGWELLMSLLMAYVGLNPPPDLTLPLPNGGNPLMIGKFIFFYNQGVLLGLTSGIPLLIAALPFWKEKYSRG